METTVLMGVLRPPDVARVQIARIVGEQVAAPQRSVHLAGSGGDARGGTADQKRRDRQAQLVEQIVFDQQAENLRAALGEHPEKPAVGQDLQGSRGVDLVGVRARRVDDLGHRSEPVAGVGDCLGRGEDQRRHFGAGEDFGVVVERAAIGDDGDGRHLGLAAALAGLALRGAELRAGVVLGPDGARTDQDDVGELAHLREDRAVAGAGQTSRLTVVGRAAVEAGDHVAAHPARLQVVGVGVEVRQPALVE